MLTRFLIFILLIWKTSASSIGVEAVPRINSNEIPEMSNQENQNSINARSDLIGNADCSKCIVCCELKDPSTKQ